MINTSRRPSAPSPCDTPSFTIEIIKPHGAIAENPQNEARLLRDAETEQHANGCSDGACHWPAYLRSGVHDVPRSRKQC